MRIGILNSGGYNFNSIQFAINRLGYSNVHLIDSNLAFDQCDRIIIPGVGHAETAMNLIRNQKLENSILETKKPVLGICLGMQIMFQFSEEGSTQCLGIFNHDIIQIPLNIRSPQMGWNLLKEGVFGNNFVYFANKYFAPINNYTESYVDYEGIQMTSIIRKNNFLGCQFHPEKSGNIGQQILRSFLNDII